MNQMLPFFFRKFGFIWNSKWEKTKKNPLAYQDKLFKKLIAAGANSLFGREHNFKKINTYEEFKELVPIREYEDFIPYINLILDGKNDVLYPGRPTYFAKTSGTTAEIKLIPVYPEILKAYASSAINMLISYARNTDNYSIFGGKMMVIQGSPALENMNGIMAGKMSGISYHAIPPVFKPFLLPSLETNIIDDIHHKIDAMAEESSLTDLRVLSGLPPWIMLYIERLLQKTDERTVKDIFPNLQLLLHGGVNFEPYKNNFFKKIGKKIDTLDCYSASEGHIGFQEHPDIEGMTLCCDNGIFYEFIDIKHLNDPNAHRISLKDVKPNISYAVVLSTISGLWAYLIGDVIMFTHTYPFRFIFAGRVAEFTSLFTEHVIETEVRNAIKIAVKKLNLHIRHFTVAPMIPADIGEPYQEWWIEFDSIPDKMEALEDILNEVMCEQNYSYDDLFHSRVIKKLQVKIVERNGFEKCLANLRKLDAQGKIPTLSNNRLFVNQLEPFLLEMTE